MIISWHETYLSVVWEQHIHQSDSSTRTSDGQLCEESTKQWWVFERPKKNPTDHDKRARSWLSNALHVGSWWQDSSDESACTWASLVKSEEELEARRLVAPQAYQPCSLWQQILTNDFEKFSALYYPGHSQTTYPLDSFPTVCYVLGHLAHIFLSFLVQYVLIWSHDLDSHDWLPVQQSHLVGNFIVPSFCMFFIVLFLW